MSVLLFGLLVGAAPPHAQQSPPEKATEAITVRHIPNPTEGYLWQDPKTKRVEYKWPYRTEVRNNLDVSLQITHFEIYLYENNEWVPRNLLSFA